MANSVKFIRSMMDVKPTKEDKGLEFSIKVISYDSGILHINGHGFSARQGNATLSVARQILQMLEELETQMSRRKAIAGKTASRARKKRLRAGNAASSR